MSNFITILLLKCYDYWDLNHDLQIVKAVMTVPFLVQSFIIKVFFPELLYLNLTLSHPSTETSPKSPHLSE